MVHHRRHTATQTLLLICAIVALPMELAFAQDEQPAPAQAIQYSSDCCDSLDDCCIDDGCCGDMCCDDRCCGNGCCGHDFRHHGCSNGCGGPIANWFTKSYGLSGEERRSLADKHAPAGIMGAHVHDQGEWMFEYRYMNMYMEDNRFGSTTLSDADAISVGNSLGTNFGATPTQMTMEMHMVHIMYGVTDRVTAYSMIMLPSLTMDHIRGPMNPGGPEGSPFTTHNSGFGDTTFGMLIMLAQDSRNDLVFNLAGSVPTGDIFRLTGIPTNGVMDQPLPYPMRLGSGTFDARPGMTWKHYFDSGSLGAQLQTDLPIGRNYRGYSEGDQYRLSHWYSHLLTDNVAMSVRVENLWRSNFDGFDPQTPDRVISTNVELFRGGYWLNLGLGVMALFNGHLLNVELVPNLYQDVDGIQLETDWSLFGSWSKAY